MNLHYWYAPYWQRAERFQGPGRPGAASTGGLKPQSKYVILRGEGRILGLDGGFQSLAKN